MQNSTKIEVQGEAIDIIIIIIINIVYVYYVAMLMEVSRQTVASFLSFCLDMDVSDPIQFARIMRQVYLLSQLTG